MSGDLAPTFLPHQQPTPADLVPGVTVLRWTDNRPNFTVRAPMPCHPEQTVEVLRQAVNVVVICRVCSKTYTLAAVDDNDGGFTALFTVNAAQYQISRARTLS